MTHAELAELVRALGGEFLRNPPRGAAIVVVGESIKRAGRAGPCTKILERARKLRAYGYPIHFLSEQEFYEKLALVEDSSPVRRQLALADLTRVLQVPATRVRRWLRLGLIKTSETVHRFAYFGFAELAGARKICELTDRGVTLQEIHCGLTRMRRWLPDLDLSDPRLRVPERGRRLLASVDGRLIEADGQLNFDFKPPDSDETAVLATLKSPEDVAELFDKALELEDAGQLTEAADVYRKAVETEPADPVLHFNLGNVLFAQARFGESAKSYQRALDNDPYYAEAWNNLGNAYTELESWRAAIAAFRKAVQLVPTYRDAHENLARMLKELEKERKTRVFSDD